MTETQLAAEREYRIAERLGILCGPLPITPEAKAIAEREASEAVKRLMNPQQAVKELK